MIRYYETFKPDAVWISSDTWVTAEAMGAAVAYAAERQPLGGTGVPLIRTPADLDKIPAADPTGRGRQPLMLEALCRVKEKLGRDVFVVGCFDQAPFSLACALLGIDQALMLAATDLSYLGAVLDKCIEYATAYGLAMAQAGADMLSTGDSPAGLMGAELYRQVALPAEQHVFRKLRNLTDAFLSLHICGKVDHLLPDMIHAGADVLELDSRTDLDLACQKIPAHISVWGNLDPVALLEKGLPSQVYQEIEKIRTILNHYQRKRFVLSSGCTLSMDTKRENLEMVCASVDY